MTGGRADAASDTGGGAPAPLRHIVFYGSLMEGLTLPGKPDLAALGVTRVGPCRVHAALWDTGHGYPALTRPGDPAAGEVLGELWELADAARALPPLDAFEGLYDGDEEGSDYLRVAVRASSRPASRRGCTCGTARRPGWAWSRTGTGAPGSPLPAATGRRRSRLCVVTPPQLLYSSPRVTPDCLRGATFASRSSP